MEDKRLKLYFFRIFTTIKILKAYKLFKILIYANDLIYLIIFHILRLQSLTLSTL